MNFLSDLYHLLLLSVTFGDQLLVLCVHMLIVPMQVVKIICLLLQPLVDLAASAVFPVLLLPKFFFEPFYLHFRHPSEFVFLLQHLSFLLLKPVICLVSFPHILFCPAEILSSPSLFFFGTVGQTVGCSLLVPARWCKTDRPFLVGPPPCERNARIWFSMLQTWGWCWGHA